MISSTNELELKFPDDKPYIYLLFFIVESFSLGQRKYKSSDN